VKLFDSHRRDARATKNKGRVKSPFQTWTRSPNMHCLEMTLWAVSTFQKGNSKKILV